MGHLELSVLMMKNENDDDYVKMESRNKILNRKL